MNGRSDRTNGCGVDRLADRIHSRGIWGQIDRTCLDFLSAELRRLATATAEAEATTGEQKDNDDDEQDCGHASGYPVPMRSKPLGRDIIRIEGTAARV